jgi:hypothetical protein
LAGVKLEFTTHDLGQRKRGDVVEVTLRGSGANVRLMDSSNLSKFKSGRNHQYIGGLMKKSPALLEIPRSGHWYVTVDMFGLRGSTRSGVRILPKALPPMRTSSSAPFSRAPLVQDMPLTEIAIDRSSAKQYDVFISHASEDKDIVVRPLAHSLIEEGLQVWYDEFEMKIGDSLREKIDYGLANSRAGIVVLSPDFFRKGWTKYELNGLVGNNVAGKQKLLPIWHDLTHEQVQDYSPSLADKIARNTDEFTIEEIAAEIAEVIRGE